MQYNFDDLRRLVDCVELDFHSNEGYMIVGSIALTSDKKDQFNTEDSILFWDSIFTYIDTEVEEGTLLNVYYFGTQDGL